MRKHSTGTLLLWVALTPTLASQIRQDQGAVDPTLQLSYITLLSRPSAKQQGELDALLARQQDPSSPDYRHWLTPEQFGERFGLTDGNYSMLVSWLESRGFRVENKARARNWIAFSGNAGPVQAAFQTEIHRYLVDGRMHYANANPIKIPDALRNLVTGIRGLDDLSSKPVGPEYTTPAGVHQLAPDDWATIYDVAPLYKMGIDGTGQRIAIVGRSDINPTDMATFRSNFSLPPSPIEMHLIGPDPGITNAASEAALDLEWSGSIARNATIVYVYSNNFDNSVQAAVDQNLAPVISESYGTCEPEAAIANRSLAQQANAQGITFVASSGDAGPAACDPHGTFQSTLGTLASNGLAVGVPASYPEVTAVGGTQFNEGSGTYWSGAALSYIPEVAWNQSGTPGLLASGGGPSAFFPKPLWQSGPGVPNDNARDVPDIALTAAGHDAYIVVNNGVQIGTGGTSAAAPSFAGVVALLNQYLKSPGLGNINPQLYRLAQIAPNAFHDITQGNNNVSCVEGSRDCTTGSYGYSAAPGYDLATGLGSLDVFNFVTSWNTAAAATATTLTANPVSISAGDTFQLTASVTGGAALWGTVTFSSGQIILGTEPLTTVGGAAYATITVTGAVLPAGNRTITATYSGDSTFTGSAGTASLSVVSQSTASAVAVSISPNPAHEGQTVKVSLTEEAGVPTTVTGWAINGVDNFYRFVADFGSTTLLAGGTLSTTFTTATGVTLPSTRLYVFTGMDANGQQWTRQYPLTLVAPLTGPAITLTSAPSNVQQNGAANGACPYPALLVVQEQHGLAVQLTKFIAAMQWFTSDMTAQIPQLFGTTRLAPFGTIQAPLCLPANAPGTVTYEVDGMDQTGSPVTSTVAVTSGGTATNPSPLLLSAASIMLTSTNPTGAVTLTATGAWTVSSPPAWLTVSPLSGTGMQQLKFTASAANLGAGVYNATLILQAANALPQFVGLPVVFQIGASPAISTAGVANGASFQQAFAPGMAMSVFGAGLAPSVQLDGKLPLPLTMQGVSATVNGIPAPLYYVSPGQINLQIPYETGTGPAVVGINNNGRVAAYVFSVAPSGPGLFTDASHAIIPNASGARGQTVTLFLTGEGIASAQLATGASPFSGTPLALLPAPLLPLSVTVGGTAAAIAYVGISPGLVGVTQVNFTIPSSVAPGTQLVVVTVDGVPSAPASININP